ncbi:MAG TPA: hypothetical protein VMS19_05435 [Methyloceanibacter sp.]|nr:hypothetical protein [Methyloceanibacter sp.]
MRDGRAGLNLALVGAFAIALGVAAPVAGHAQEWSGNEGSTVAGPNIDDYLKEVGPEGKFIPHGALKIDGKSVYCGKRPTVFNPNFDSWGGAFPGFLILNDKKINGLSTQVKLYIYSHECGHQFIGADETKADLFAIRRGVKWGWLDAQGVEDICTFISQLKGDSVHPPGPQRCEIMRKYYRELVDGARQQANAPVSTTKAQTLGPSQ